LFSNILIATPKLSSFEFIIQKNETKINRGFFMPTFVLLGNYTQEGIANIKDVEKRIESGKKLVESLGGSIKGIYYTMGRYDFIIITEAPSNEAAMKALIATAGVGAIRTETLTAFTQEEFVKLVKEVP
jgi:uncharacterized protein with GYD domain